jgi:hypothetical protein
MTVFFIVTALNSSNLSHINIYYNHDILKTSTYEILKLYSVLMQPAAQDEFCFTPWKISEFVSHIKKVMPDKYYLPIQRIQTHGFGLSDRSSVAIIG